MESIEDVFHHLIDGVSLAFHQREKAHQIITEAFTEPEPPDVSRETGDGVSRETTPPAAPEVA